MVRENKVPIKILIVEDESLIALNIQDKLTELGYDAPMIADNGPDAIKYAGDLMPDIVLMDILLKGDMDGIEATEKIMELYNIPSVFLTAYNSPSTMERISKFSHSGFLLKPFDDSKLQDTILQLYIEDSKTLKEKRTVL
jgi:CheY-like chemotaxis protein